jgi:hypothetical protein
MSETTLISNDRTSHVTIDRGELISYIKDGEELIHQKGSPGWERSDIEMFPVIGPTDANNNIVSTHKGDCIQGQHGFLRELKYHLMEKESNTAKLKKDYKGLTKIKNSKELELYWPFDFTFTKSFELFDEALHIQFELNSEKGMPYMLGYHPAFKLSGKGDEIIKIQSQKITIDDVLKKGGSAYPFFDVDKLTLIKKEGYNIHLKTQGFHNIMFWTEVKNMICLEPITQYPDLDTQRYSEKNMRISNENDLFSIEITPFKN